MIGFSGRLKELRNEKKITQQQLADRFNVNKATVSRWESGVFEPDTETIKQIADYFDVTVDFLLGKSDNPEDIPALEEKIFSSEPDLIEIMKHTKPHINGVPINEEQAEIFIEFLEAYYRRKLKEIEDEKNNQANKQ